MVLYPSAPFPDRILAFCCHNPLWYEDKAEYCQQRPTSPTSMTSNFQDPCESLSSFPTPARSECYDLMTKFGSFCPTPTPLLLTLGRENPRSPLLYLGGVARRCLHHWPPRRPRHPRRPGRPHRRSQGRIRQPAQTARHPRRRLHRGELG